ncbi:hypothetical protein ACFOW6_17365 [Fodinicurvata halophila]|uniref:Uncharacterized protein n=1 Tax=Fodinicurvata halophila TaxID=1419723 RepID=A0ABV8URG9_9PROT
MERPYPTGTAFVDPAFDNAYTAFNPSAEEAVVMATFLDAPDEGKRTIPIDEDEGERSWKRNAALIPELIPHGAGMTLFLKMR